MADHILSLLRIEARRRLYSIQKRFLFGANVGTDLAVASVGHNVKDIEMSGHGEKKTDSLEGTVNSSEGNFEMNLDRTNHSIESQIVAGTGESSNNSDSVATRDFDETGMSTTSDCDFVGAAQSVELSKQQSDTVQREMGETPSHITPPQFSTILYLGPLDLRDSWEFQTIAVENQSTQALLINLRRLFPREAEHFLAIRNSPGNALAVQSSEITSGMLRHLLRLAFYLEGDETTNMTQNELEEHKMRERDLFLEKKRGYREERESTDAVNQPEKVAAA